MKDSLIGLLLLRRIVEKERYARNKQDPETSQVCDPQTQGGQRLEALTGHPLGVQMIYEMPSAHFSHFTDLVMFSMSRDFT